MGNQKRKNNLMGIGLLCAASLANQLTKYLLLMEKILEEKVEWRLGRIML